LLPGVFFQCLEVGHGKIMANPAKVNSAHQPVNVFNGSRSGVVMNMPFPEARKKSSVLKAVPAPNQAKCIRIAIWIWLS